MSSDVILSKEDVLKAVREKIAGEVLAHLDDATKTAIITDAVAEIIGGYEFKKILDAEVKKVAAHELINHLSQPDVKESLRRQAVAAATMFVETFGPAMLTMLYKAAGVVEDSRASFTGGRATDIGEAIKKQLGIDERR